MGDLQQSTEFGLIMLIGLFVYDSSPNLAYNDDEVASYDDEDDQGQQDTDGRLNPVRTGWSTEERYSSRAVGFLFNPLIF